MFDLSKNCWRAAVMGALFVATYPALAEPPAAGAPDVPQPVTAAAPSLPVTYHLPPLFPVDLIVVDEVSSKIAITGQPVRLVLARPLYVTADLGLPEGTAVEGVVIHAAKGGMGGKSGELLIAARRIAMAGDIAIPLRSFQVAPAHGKNNEGLAFGVSAAVGFPGLLITGGSARIPAGTRAFAKTREAVDLPAALLAKLPPQPVTIVPAPAAPTSSTKGE